MDESQQMVSIPEFSDETSISIENTEELIRCGVIRSDATMKQVPRSEIERFLRERCYHEAGHALQAQLLGWRILGLSVRPTGTSGGRAPMEPPPDENPWWQPYDASHDAEFRRRAGICYHKVVPIMAAGREAQRLFGGEYPPDEVIHSDIDFIRFHAGFLLDESVPDAKTAMEACARTVHETLLKHKLVLDELAQHLCRDQELSRAEVDAFFVRHDL